jgi:hypothetical protein
MAVTERENYLKALRHEKAEYMPDLFAAVHYVFASGFHERPPFNQGGKDWFGVDWIYGETGGAPVPDHQQPPLLIDICQWRDQVKFPDLDAWDWEEAIKLDNILSIDRETKLVDLMLLEGPFERLHSLMGFENALITLMEEPEEVTAFLDAFMEYKCKLIDKIATYYKPDIIMFHDDWGTQLNMFFSPVTWRSLFKPQIKKAADACHKLGIAFEMHSCGKMDQIVPEFVEIGIDSFQGMCINNVPQLKEKTANRLLYIMSVDYQRYDAAEGFLTEKEVRAEIRNEVLKCAEGGNYVPMVTSAQSWWYTAAQEEIGKCRLELDG